MPIRKLPIFLFILTFFCSPLSGQSTADHSFWMPSDTLNKKRFWTVAGGGAAAYSIATVGLFEAWYKDYPIGKFRFFDDSEEWEKMDKMGHAFTAYTESYLAYKGARWTGIRHKPSILIGAGVGTFLQATVEVMDGFSEQWGFSWADIAYNTAGVVLFTGQELLWRDQRIVLKVSNSLPNYDDSTPIYASNNDARFITLQDVANDLYGTNVFERFLKDYNGMTVWASVNPASFITPNNEDGPIPAWLNLAVGYSGENVFGAYGNGWRDDDGNRYNLSQYKRGHQIYLALDADLSRIKTKSPVLKTIFTALRWVKIPSPAVELSSSGKTEFHWLFW